MDGYKFESQCATILKKKHFKKIEVTKSSCDQGIDIIAYKHGKKICRYIIFSGISINDSSGL